jgi:hypothetical protein
MTGTRPDWIPQRPGTLLPIVGAHIGALLLVVGSSAAPVSPDRETRLTIVDISAAPAPAARPPEPVIGASAAIPVPLISSPPILMRIADIPAPSASDQPGVGSDCDLTDVVQAAVRNSPPARSALLMLPRGARSVANAVMLWDGAWTDGTTTSTRYALGKVRAVVTAAIDAASPDCRAAMQAGPRLAVVPGAPDIVIAFGSGRWRWGDLGAAPALTVAANDITERSVSHPRPATAARPN